jgi:hypothetical protein
MIDLQTGLPIEGATFYLDTTSDFFLTDSSGRIEFERALFAKKETNIISVSKLGYYDSQVSLERVRGYLAPLVFIDSTHRYWNPFVDLDSLDGQEICKQPDVYPTYSEGWKGLTDYLRSEGWVNERKSKKLFGVNVCFIVTTKGEIQNLKIKIAAPVAPVVYHQGTRSLDDMACDAIRHEVLQLFQTLNKSWTPGIKDQKSVCSEISLRFQTPLQRKEQTFSDKKIPISRMTNGDSSNILISNGCDRLHHDAHVLQLELPEHL